MNMTLKVTLLALCIAVCVPVQAARRRAMGSPASVLSIEFVPVPASGGTFVAAGSDGWMDVESVSKQPGAATRSTRVLRRFAIRIVRTGGVAWGTAVLTARLDAMDGRSSLRVDGRALSTVPVVIDARAAVGATTIHTLEIEVPDSVAAGPLAASISWEATTQ